MKGYRQISWKFAIFVLVSVCYLGILLSYVNVQPQQEFVAEDQPISVMVLATSATQRNWKTKKPKFKLTTSVISNSKQSITSKTLTMIMNNVTHMPSANVSEKNIITSARIVIIAAYMRTGSTLMGGMFHHYPGTFYVFEPLRHIADAFKSFDAKNLTLMYTSGKRRKFTFDDKREDIFLKDINKWLTCNFQEIDIDTFVDKHHLNFKDSLLDVYKCAISHVEVIQKFRDTIKSRNAQNVTEALIVKNLKAINECLSEAKQKCLKAPLRVFKFIRVRMPLVADLLPLYPNMKVIYLQRDPRGMFRSRVRTKLIKDSKKFTSSVLEHCNDSLKDIETLKLLSDRNPGRIKAVQYEDVAERPLEIFESIFRFCGLNFTSNMEKYTLSLTSLGGKDACAFCIERGNSSKTAYQWRKKMNISDVKFIDTHCMEVNKILGYQRFSRLTDLRNFSLSSKTSTKLIL